MGHVVDDDIGALLGQFEDDRLANTGIAAGHDGNLVLQRHKLISIAWTIFIFH
ncbi:hypothetical protein [Methyloceanibacter marginalis]|uniref:hypothetical protein n=1 Tax=Methyloceanibacter marginalis TaxID=1774971 RepID=UPI001FCE00B8|nr:hypothetical protein [Methyloceanibacter marginalis]